MCVSTYRPLTVTSGRKDPRLTFDQLLLALTFDHVDDLGLTILRPDPFPVDILAVLTWQLAPATAIARGWIVSPAEALAFNSFHQGGTLIM